jgi:regulatory protein
MEKQKGTVTRLMVLDKIRHYCAYQERCHAEVRSKLLEMGMRGDDLEEIIYELVQDNYLNEERFAKIFAGGKFRIKKWGRNKIIRQLKAKKVSEYCIRKGLEEIDEESYQSTLNELMQKKWQSLKEKNQYIKKNKTAKYLIGKGYEPEKVWSSLRKMG